MNVKMYALSGIAIIVAVAACIIAYFITFDVDRLYYIDRYPGPVIIGNDVILYSDISGCKIHLIAGLYFYPTSATGYCKSGYNYIGNG